MFRIGSLCAVKYRRLNHSAKIIAAFTSSELLEEKGVSTCTVNKTAPKAPRTKMVSCCCVNAKTVRVQCVCLCLNKRQYFTVFFISRIALAVLPPAPLFDTVWN